MRPITAFLLVLACLAHDAAAQVAPEAKPAAPARRAVVAPMSRLAEGGGDLAPIGVLVGQGVAAVPGLVLVPDKELRAALKKAKRKELEACEGEPACLAELGKLVSAEVVVAGEVGELGDGQVVYLKAVDVATGKELGSTTAVLAGGQPQRASEARGAAFRMLAPAAYVGSLALNIDVSGAVVYVDGKQVGKSPIEPLKLGVGTHALRVTHEKYRDFVRFVDVKFEDVSTLEVPLKAFPVVENQMIEHDKKPKAPVGPVAPSPWYRKTWAVAGFAGVVLVATTVTVALLAGGIDSDREVIVGEK